jgi:hypothetical protein
MHKSFIHKKFSQTRQRNIEENFLVDKIFKVQKLKSVPELLNLYSTLVRLVHCASELRVSISKKLQTPETK